MTDQKHEDIATTEGMPEVVVHAPPPPVDNDHVAPGAEQFAQHQTPAFENVATAQVATPAGAQANRLQGEIQGDASLAAFKVRVANMEEAVHTFLTHNAGVGHAKVKAWLTSVEDRLHPKPSPIVTPAGPTETTPPSVPSTGEPTGSSTSTTLSSPPPKD